MSVVVLVLLFAAIAAVVGAMVVMYVKDKPLYGALGLCALLGPGVLLTFVYVALSHG